MGKQLRRVVGPKWPMHVGNVMASVLLLALFLVTHTSLWLVIAMAVVAGASTLNLIMVVGVRRDADRLGFLDELDRMMAEDGR